MAQPKTEYIRSATLMGAYRLIPCQQCGRDDGTVCGAHSNWAEHGKGKSIKASDDMVASLCMACHHDLDQGKGMSRQERKDLWTLAHTKTVAELVRRGLWPAGVPLPIPLSNKPPALAVRAESAIKTGALI